MRYSYQREEILKIVQGTKCHPTADWVYDEVRKIVSNISLGTVYRNLNQLVDNHQISALNDGPVVRYDGFIEPHDHFKCTVCYTIYDIYHQNANVLNELNKNNSHTISSYSLNLVGVCSSCKDHNKN